ncbi:MAG TPA: hypothetical protein VKX46_17850 [Ktedonobacteraceae bacterium]|nr:hypothetical protein [Ktedonobacteraceae bacterium]
MKTRTPPIYYMISISLSLLCIGTILAACQTNAGASASPNISTQANNPTVSVVGSPSRNSGPFTQSQCGTIALNPAGKLANPKLAQRVGNCFWQAYQQCHTASFVFMIGGIDTVLMRTFHVEKKRGACTVTDLVQYRVVPRPLPAGQSYSCKQVINDRVRLQIQECGKDGTVTVPMAPTEAAMMPRRSSLLF